MRRDDDARLGEGEAGQEHTVRRSMLSNLCLGTTVTSSISHKKATSEGTSPGGRGRAMMVRNRRPVGRGNDARQRRNFEVGTVRSGCACASAVVHAPTCAKSSQVKSIWFGLAWLNLDLDPTCTSPQLAVWHLVCSCRHAKSRPIAHLPTVPSHPSA